MSSALIDHLLATCSAVVERAAHERAAELDGIDRVAAALRPPAVQRPIPTHCPSPVPELLESTLELANNDADRAFAHAIRDSAAELHWRMPYANHDEPDIVALRAGYFVASLIGPKETDAAPVYSEAVAVYVTVMAPGLFYAAHVHKAPELYHVIAGEALWQKGGRPFTAEEPGAWIVHPTGTRHAMETTDQPLLTTAIWTDDLESVPVIVRD